MAVQASLLLSVVVVATLGLPGEHAVGPAQSASPLIEAIVNDNASLALQLLSDGAAPAALDVITPLYAAQEYIANSRERRRLLRALLADPRGVTDVSAGRLRVRLPVQLMWHGLDLGADLPQVLDALLPLLSTEIAGAVSAAVAARRPIDASYEQPSWRIAFRLPKGQRPASAA